MANRHLSRSIVMQSLFEWDFRNASKKELETILEKNINEFGPGLGDDVFMQTLLHGVISKQKEINRIIEKAAPEWPIDKISIVDRNILRIGLYELLFGDRKEVPPKVSINEAIELAKTFGGETSGKFVNGVLGAVYKEIGEPGKEEQSKHKNNNHHKEPVDISKLPIEKLGGAVAYARDENNIIHLALVHDVFGYWTLSKGHIEAGETLEEGTKREIKEETGLTISIEKDLGSNEYIASDPEKGKIRKQVSYFLASSPFVEVKLEKTGGGLDDVRWFSLEEIPELRIYDDIIPIITKGINLLMKHRE
ncbi:MAG: transcription antitermination factor NusB [Parcubacteria group bacterium]|nr:transcription antitermination factor NusB [Parcubacteria group bacterium]